MGWALILWGCHKRACLTLNIGNDHYLHDGWMGKEVGGGGGWRNIIQPWKSRQSYHSQQHRWTLKALCYTKQVRQRKTNTAMISLTFGIKTKNKLMEKEIRPVVTGGGRQRGGTGGRWSKVQTSSEGLEAVLCWPNPVQSPRSGRKRKSIIQATVSPP